MRVFMNKSRKPNIKKMESRGLKEDENYQVVVWKMERFSCGAKRTMFQCLHIWEKPAWARY